MLFYTPADIADILRVSYDTALTWIKASGVEYYKVGKQYRVAQSSFEKMFTTSDEPVKQKLRMRPVYVIQHK